MTHEKPNSIGVEDIRSQVNNDMAIKPYSSPYKIYIINEGEKMTVQAQNALLKTLEEPPAYVIFILATTEAHKIIWCNPDSDNECGGAASHDCKPVRGAEYEACQG